MTDETKCWRGWLVGDEGCWKAKDYMFRAGATEVYVRPVPDHGLTPGTRVRWWHALNHEYIVGTVRGYRGDGRPIMVCAEGRLWSRHADDITPITDEPRTYTEEEIEVAMKHAALVPSIRRCVFRQLARLRGTP